MFSIYSLSALSLSAMTRRSLVAQCAAEMMFSFLHDHRFPVLSFCNPCPSSFSATVPGQSSLSSFPFFGSDLSVLSSASRDLLSLIHCFSFIYEIDFIHPFIQGTVIFPFFKLFDDFSTFQWYVLCYCLCSYVESFSHLTCIITTALLFVNPQHRTNFFSQNCTYSIRTDAKQTNQSGHRRKNLAFFCVCSAITQHHTKRSRSFSPKRSAPVPQ